MRIKILLASLIFSFGLFVSNAQAIQYWGDKLLTDEAVDFKEQASSPTNPSTDRWKLYFKSDGSLYKLDESGVETELASKASEIQDSDGDTKVQVEESADDDTIRFDAAGSEVGTWTSSLLTTTTPVTVGGAVKTTGIEDSDGDTAVKVEESADEDIIRFDVATAEVAQFKAAEIVFNEAGANRDFRVESDTKPQMFFLDASENRIYFGEKGSSTGRGQVVSVTDSIASPNLAQFTADTPGNAQGEKSSFSFFSTFEGSADNSPRRTADILAGFDGGTWGKEYIAFHVGNDGASNNAGNLTDEKARITQDGMVIGGTDLTPDGPLHIGAGLAGSVTAHSDGDIAVIESDSARFGMSFLGDATSRQFILFGDTDDNNVGKIDYNHGNNALLFTSGGSLRAALFPAALVVNEIQNSTEFRVKGDSESNLFQVNVASDNISMGASSGDASALLDLVSTSKGLGLPSMTTTQRDAISAPRDGLAIYNSTTGEVNVRENGAWVAPSSPTKIQDADGDTKIDTEESADEDIIRFDVLGSQAGRIDTTGWVLKGNDVSGDGPLHIGAGLAGAVTANANGDGVILEDSGNTGYSILVPDDGSIGHFIIGSPANNQAARLQYQPANGVFYMLSGGEEFLRANSSGVVFNENSFDHDLRMEGGTNANLFYLNAGTDNIGLGSASPDASALLDMVSTTKGLGVPSMTGTQRDAISTPRDGLVVHNSTTDTIDARLNSAWESLATTSGSGQISCETVQASTSGTSIDFTSLPSSIRRITVIFDQVSLSGADRLLVQIGDSGGLETTSYESSHVNQGGNGASSTTGFVQGNNSASSSHSGNMTLERITGNRWIEHSVIGLDTSANVWTGSGTKTLSAELDRLSIVPSGSNNFDNGQINVCTEL